ncbi:nucleotide exchange factor GrpE [[Eubacterium] cellulosolvens]
MGATDEKAAKGLGEKESQLRKKVKPSKRPPAERQTLARREDGELRLIPAGELLSLKEQLKQEQEKSKEYLNKLLYAQADFENYRRRLDQEVESRIESGKAKLIKNLLTIVDELELALEAAKHAEGASGIAAGLEIVLKRFHDLLNTEGLALIETVGREFNPALHEAVERVERTDTEEGTILEEVRKGFTLKGKLIRPSIVKIAVPHIAKPDSTERIERGES